MKRNTLLKVLSILISATLSIGMCGCEAALNGILNPDTAVTTKWPDEKWILSLTEYKKGRISDVSFTDSEEKENVMLRICVKDTSEAEFKDYIEELKGDGFSYYDITGLGVAEKLSLDENASAITWTAYNAQIYVSVMYIDPLSTYAKTAGCDVMITAYNERPSAWSDASESAETAEK